MTNYILKPLSQNKKATGNAYYFSRRNKEKILNLIKKIYEDNLPSMLPEDSKRLLIKLNYFFNNRLYIEYMLNRKKKENN